MREAREYKRREGGWMGGGRWLKVGFSGRGLFFPTLLVLFPSLFLYLPGLLLLHPFSHSFSLPSPLVPNVRLCALCRNPCGSKLPCPPASKHFCLSVNLGSEMAPDNVIMCACACVFQMCSLCTMVCFCVCTMYVCVYSKSTVRLLLPIILCYERNRVFESKGLPW